MIKIITLAALLLLPALTLAQGPGPRGPGGAGPGGDPLAGVLFPPDLVMRHQDDLQLDATQREALIEEMQSTQSDLVPLQWEMREAGEKLRALLDPPRIDEEQALAQADRMTSIEQRVKRRHLALLIRIKNLLTPEQQAQLGALRPRHARGAMPGGAGGL
jgi:Spy/CpxP family protein refolding chaperone